MWCYFFSNKKSELPYWITNITFEWLLSFMNYFNMPIQNFFSKTYITSMFTFLKGFFSSWTDLICTFRSPFWETLWSHSNGFFPSWTDSINLIKYFFARNHIWMASFLYELIPYAYSNLFFEKKQYNKHCIWMASFLHEQIQYAELVCHKHYIWMASFLHELI